MRGAFLIVVGTIAFQMSHWVLAQANHIKRVTETSSNISANSTSINKTDLEASTALPVHDDSAKGSQGSSVKSAVIPKQNGTKDITGAIIQRLLDLAKKKMITSPKIKGDKKLEKEFGKGDLKQNNNVMTGTDKEYPEGLKFSQTPIEFLQEKTTGCLLDEHDIDELFAKLHRRGYKYSSPDELSFRSASHYKPPNHRNVYPEGPRAVIPPDPIYYTYEGTIEPGYEDYSYYSGGNIPPYDY